MGYSELVQRLFEKMKFFLWTPYNKRDGKGDGKGEGKVEGKGDSIKAAASVKHCCCCCCYSATAALMLSCLCYAHPATATKQQQWQDGRSSRRAEQRSGGAAGLGLWVCVVRGGSLCVRTFLVWGTVPARPDTKFLCRGNFCVGPDTHFELNLVLPTCCRQTQLSSMIWL